MEAKVYRIVQLVMVHFLEIKNWLLQEVETLQLKKLHWNKTVEEIIGNGKVQKVVLRDTKTNEKTTLEVGGIFVAIGHDPNTKLFANQIELDKQGYIVLKENTKTSVKGVFAAGDVHDRRYRQAITAAGFGCMAAIEVDKFLSEN